VNAYNAFVTWAIEFIQSTLNALFGPLIDKVQSMSDRYCSNVYAACGLAQNDIENGGTLSDESKIALSQAIMGDLFIVLMGAVVVISVALLVLTVVTGPFSFLTEVVASMLVSLLVVSMLGGIVSALGIGVEVSQAISDVIGSLFVYCGGSLEDLDYLSSAIDSIIVMFDGLGAGFIAMCPGMPSEYIHLGYDLAMAALGLALSLYSTTFTVGAGTILFDTVALVMCGYALYELNTERINVKQRITRGLLENTGQTIIFGIAELVAGVGVLKATWDIYRDVSS
jgi:hypothetical protein